MGNCEFQFDGGFMAGPKFAQWRAKDIFLVIKDGVVQRVAQFHLDACTQFTFFAKCADFKFFKADIF